MNYLAVIKVVGVGGGGTNAVNRMVDSGMRGVEFIAVNTDCAGAADVRRRRQDPHRQRDHARPRRRALTPTSARQAVEESRDEMQQALKGADMVFVTAGEGGGTGTGAAPGHRRTGHASWAPSRWRRHAAVLVRGQAPARIRRRTASRALRGKVDTLIIIPNDRLLQVVERRTTIVEASRWPTTCCARACRASRDLITVPGLINLDFADVRTIMKEAGTALMGIGVGRGETAPTRPPAGGHRSPLLETAIERRSRHPAQHHRRQRPVAVRGQRGGGEIAQRRRRRCQHHLRSGHRRAL